VKRDGDESRGNESIVEVAMEALKAAATNILTYKLDLKAIFQHFDTRKDGLLTQKELAESFLRMGVKLDAIALDAIFK